MISGLNTHPTDEALAVEFRWTLHTRYLMGWLIILVALAPLL